jgi:hypothetical protein
MLKVIEFLCKIAYRPRLAAVLAFYNVGPTTEAE